MHDSRTLPDLRVLATRDLLPHENADPRRVERLSKRILENGVLKNPPIVAPIEAEGPFVVLDGANRVAAFKHVGIPHIVAQVVRYDDPEVILDTWYHVVSGMALAEFEQALEELVGLRLVGCSLSEARETLQRGDAIAYIVCEAGVLKALPRERDADTMQLLNDIVGAYKGRADIFRASNDIWEIQKPYYPEITALIVFPQLRPADIIAAALGRHKIPSGITRHIIPARALNINFPIGVLMSAWSAERKREWLHEWLMERMAANAIRFYAESTFTFNE
ncbi:MAG: ParB N-terminal domain-containing protein [Chloroflexi bacterium]|nr:ParB N-terminal domain-containing protein [Chloroflexota bacterium]